MADKIRGITIELNGDSTGLMKAIKQTNSALKQTQSSLKDVNKLLKLDPSNVTLLKQKQDYLKTSINETSKKLEEEKKVLEELKKSGDSSKTVEQQRALERQIADTTNKLEELKKESKEFGNVASQQFGVAAQKIKEVGKNVTEVGKNMTTHVTAPIMAVGAASMAAFSEVDAAMDTVVTKTGASGEALESMQKIVGDLATSIPVSFEDAGTAVGEVNTRFGVTGDELAKLSSKFLKFAQLNGTDVNSSIDATQKSMAAWGIQADQTGEYLDTLNKVGQNTGISMDSLNAAMASNAETFQQMGLGAADAANFLGQIEMSGMDSSVALKGLQTAMKKAADEGKTLPEALGELQKVMDSSKSDTEKLNAAIEMFGSKAGPQMFNVMQQGTVTLDEFGAALTDSFGSVEQTFDATLDPVDQMTTAMNDLKLAGAELGASIQEVLAPVLEVVAEKLRELRTWWESLDPVMQQNIVKIGLVVAAIGPLLVVIGTVIGSIGTVVGAIGSVIAVLGGPLTVAIGAAIAAGVLLYQNWDTVKEKATEMYEKVKQAFEDMKNKVIEVKNSIVENVGNMITKVKNLIKLPHISISGEFSLNPPSAPHFSIDWYAKAMKNGMILNGATIFGAANGKLLGGGEAGPEAVVGVNSLMSMIRSAVGDTINYGGVNVVVYGAPGQDVNELADIISDRINAQVNSRRAVFA